SSSKKASPAENSSNSEFAASAPMQHCNSDDSESQGSSDRSNWLKKASSAENSSNSEFGASAPTQHRNSDDQESQGSSDQRNRRSTDVSTPDDLQDPDEVQIIVCVAVLSSLNRCDALTGRR